MSQATFLWQIAQAGSSCREAIRQAQSLCQLAGRSVPPHQTSPYCQARSRIPVDRLEEIHNAVVRAAEENIRSKDLWCGLRVRVVDATCVTAPDTPLNQKALPEHWRSLVEFLKPCCKPALKLNVPNCSTNSTAF